MPPIKEDNISDFQEYSYAPKTHLVVSKAWINANAEKKQDLRNALTKMTEWKNSNADAVEVLTRDISEMKETFAIIRDQAVQVLMSTELSESEIRALQNILRMTRQ